MSEEDELVQVPAVNETAARREKEEDKWTKEAGETERQTETKSGERETDESPGEETRRRGKGTWRWEKRQQEEMMARGR